VEGLTAVGAPLPTGGPIDTAVPLAPAQVVDFSTLDTAVGTAIAAPYLLSPPNEWDPGEHGDVVAPHTYRLSPPNETDPGL
jgi:hypothetical protein